MELRDLIVTPIILLIIYAGAYKLRPLMTDSVTRGYFFPALHLKIFGAIALGVLYQFYYEGGDTFMYHTYGSRLVWEAFLESPTVGIKLLFANGSYDTGIYHVAKGIYFFRDPYSYQVIRLAGVFDLFTFSTYSSTACFFAVLSFLGSWQFFRVFYDQYPRLHKQLAIAAFFIPSVFFWGSGIMKDTIILAAMGIATFSFYRLFIQHRFSVFEVIILLICLYAMYSIRVFILMAFVPAVILWIGLHNAKNASLVLRLMLIPFVLTLILISSYYAVINIGQSDEKYAVANLAKTAKVTAYDIRYWTGRNAGSGYSLGELDGSAESMIRLAPQAIVVSLYRPYVWEIRNPLMVMTAVESLLLLTFTGFVLFRKPKNVVYATVDPNVIFAIVFSITFAFAVGISTYNFGTLARYKIPLMPFFAVALILINSIEGVKTKYSRSID